MTARRDRARAAAGPRRSSPAAASIGSKALNTSRTPTGITNVTSRLSPRRSAEAELVGGQRQRPSRGHDAGRRRDARRRDAPGRGGASSSRRARRRGAPPPDQLEVALLEARRAEPQLREQQRRASAHHAASAATRRGSGAAARPSTLVRRPGAPATRTAGDPPRARASTAASAAASAASSARDEPEPDAAAPRPRSARPGVPLATIRPRSRTATRSARRSTSPSSWVVSRIVVPAARRAAIRSRVACLAAGSMPAVGSSRTSSSGPPEQRQRQREALLLAAGQAPVPRPRRRPEVDGLEQRVRVLRVAVTAGRTAAAPRAGSSGCRSRPPGASARSAAAGAAPVARRVQAQHPDGPAVGAPVALEDLDGRRLAGAVRAEQGEQLAPPDVERDARQDSRPAYALRSPSTRIAGRRPGRRRRRPLGPRPSRGDLGVLGVEVLGPHLADLDRRAGSRRRR